MLHIFSRLLRNRQSKEAGIYFLANAFKAALSLIVMPIHTHILPPAQYGLWSIWSSVKSFFEQIADVGQKSVIQKHFHTDNDFAQTLSNTLLLVFTACIASFICLLILAYSKQILFGVPTKYYLLIPIFALGTEVYTLNTILLRHENKAFKFCLYQVGYALSTAVLGIIFVLLLNNNWLGFMLGAGISLATIGCLSLFEFFKRYQLKPNFSSKKIMALFIVGAPMIFYGINTMVITMSDRLILAHLFDSAIVGVYSANYKIGMTIQIIIYAVSNTIVPWQYKKLKDLTPSTKLSLARFNILYKVAMAFVALLIMLLGPVAVTYLFSSAYHGMNSVIYWTVLAGLAQAWYSLYFHYVIYAEKTKIFIGISIAASIINIALTIVLSKYIGPVGAAIATFIAYFIIFTGLFYQSQKSIKLPWAKAFKSIFVRSNNVY